MCSFLLTNALLLRIGLLNRLMRLRGPDATTRLQTGGLTFLHNLLHMSGARRAQPLRGGAKTGRGVWALFNGEVYNYRDLEPQAQSDGEALVPAYQRWGAAFVRRLEGEFALCIADLEAGRFVVAVDPFGTKPLYYGRTRDPGIARSSPSGAGEVFGVASYPSALAAILGTAAVRKVPPNTFLVFDSEFRLLERRAVFEFDLLQHKRHFGDWRASLEAAVLRRAGPRHLRRPLFLGLSSGYDSGALHLALLRRRLGHTAYAVVAREDPGLLRRRVHFSLLASAANSSGRGDGKRLPRAGRAQSRVLQLSGHALEREEYWVRRHVEPHKYELRPGVTSAGGSNHHDPAAWGLSAICRDAGARGGHRALLSAAGGDELFSDYGHPWAIIASEFSAEPDRLLGIFPEELGGAFPWRNFFLGSQRDYLMKEEFVAGAHGVEARFPFLDRRVVQEFLWITWDSKNRHYKAPIHSYLASFNYPFVAPLPLDLHVLKGDVLNAEFRRGFSAGYRPLASRSAVVTDFAPGDRFCARCLERCWGKVEARVRKRGASWRRREAVLRACAQGRAGPLAEAFRRCFRAAGRNATEPDTDARACAESYLLARRAEGSCLALLQLSGGPPAVELALHQAALSGLCASGDSCRAAAAQRWGIVRTPPPPPELPVVDPECRLDGVGPGDVGGLEADEGGEEQESLEVEDRFEVTLEDPSAAAADCAAELLARGRAYASASSLPAYRPGGMLTEAWDAGLLALRCVRAGGALGEVWFNLGGWITGMARGGIVGGEAGRILARMKTLSVEELIRGENFHACLPKRCYAAAPRARGLLVWRQLVLGHFLGLEEEQMRGLPDPVPGSLLVVPTEPLHDTFADEALETVAV